MMADVFDAEVYQFEVGNSASLGAALRAAEAEARSRGDAVRWESRSCGDSRNRFRPAGFHPTARPR